MCFADVKGVWDPFEEAVRAAGRQRGLTRARLPKTALAVLYAGGMAVAALAAAAVGDASPTGWACASFAGLAVLGAVTRLAAIVAERLAERSEIR